jgi:hypothetical protein
MLVAQHNMKLQVRKALTAKAVKMRRVRKEEL